jgi:hypothetical protein
MQHGRAVGAVAALAALILASCTPPRTSEEKIIRISDYRTGGRIDFNRLESDVKVNFGGKKYTYTRPAKCKDGKPACLVDVDIAAGGKSWDIQPLNGPGGQRVIGYIENKDKDDTELAYGLNPRSVYFIVVDDAQINLGHTSKTVWGLEGKDGQFVAKGYVVKCHATGYSNQTSDVDLRAYDDCVGPARTASVNQSSVVGAEGILRLANWLLPRRASTPAAYGLGSVWFECDPGCCSGTSVLQ